MQTFISVNTATRMWPEQGQGAGTKQLKQPLTKANALQKSLKGAHNAAQSHNSCDRKWPSAAKSRAQRKWDDPLALHGYYLVVLLVQASPLVGSFHAHVCGALNAP